MGHIKHEFGTVEYYHERVIELENERNRYYKEVEYYRQQLADAHALLGRTMHQLSERWDSVRVSEYYPTNNLHGKRTFRNPEGK